jgi:cytochrome c
MKKYILILMVGSLMACNGNGQGKQAEATNGIAQEPAQTDVLAEGRQLIQSSDCKACHMDDAKIIGPAYQEVAEKYENTEENITFLASKIIEGGSGNWGEVPMTPHPQHTQEEARKMAQYILSLNQE